MPRKVTGSSASRRGKAANHRAQRHRKLNHGRADHGSDAPERLQKVLARSGLGSRRDAENWIRAGRVTINGEPAILGVRIVPSDHVRLDGRLIRQRATGGAARVFICHRSPGEHLQQPLADSETPDPGVAPAGPNAPATALLERLPRRAGRRFIPVSPMPRVDGGLELVTSDGELALRLQRSVRSLSIEFSVRVHGELGSGQLEGVLAGKLDSGAALRIESCEPSGGEGSNRWYALIARGASGKEVRQLFERQGALVSRILRTQLGSLTLDRSLGRGRFRELEPGELDSLLSSGSAEAARTT